jgi:hypothetical protein
MSVSTGTAYGLDGQESGIASRQGTEIFLFFKLLTPTLGPNQPPIHWVLRALSHKKLAGAWSWPCILFPCFRLPVSFLFTICLSVTHFFMITATYRLKIHFNFKLLVCLRFQALTTVNVTNSVLHDVTPCSLAVNGYRTIHCSILEHSHGLAECSAY